MDQHHQTVRDQRQVHLVAVCGRVGTVQFLQSQVLLDPPEEQFDHPSMPVDVADLFRRTIFTNHGFWCIVTLAHTVFLLCCGVGNMPTP
jgi:hypothetical protein